jgi:hypothetical protein
MVRFNRAGGIERVAATSCKTGLTGLKKNPVNPVKKLCGQRVLAFCFGVIQLCVMTLGV